MKTVLLAMTEEQHDKRSWRANALIGTFLALTLTLNFSVRQQSALAVDAITTYNSNNRDTHYTKGGDLNAAAAAGGEIDSDRALFIFTASAAALQVIVTGIVLTFESSLLKGDHLPDKESLVILTVAHVGTTFLRDFLAGVGVSSSLQTTVHDVAFFSPVLALAALWIVTSVPARPATWISLFVVGLGCAMISTRSSLATGFDTTSSSTAESNRAALVCGLAFFAAAMRNIVLRQLVHAEGVEFKSRALPAPYNRVEAWAAMTGLGVLAVCSVFMLAPEGWGPAALCVAISCVLSAALFLVTAHVLRVFGVVSAALFGVWALLVEALILTPLALRPTLLTCILGLVLLGAGHVLLMRSLPEQEGGVAGSGQIGVTGASDSTIHRKPVSINEQYTRLEFLLFASAVVGIIFYVFQPRVSQRDLHTLSYVGLDNVIRRLLSVGTGRDAGQTDGLTAGQADRDDSSAAHMMPGNR